MEQDQLLLKIGKFSEKFKFNIEKLDGVGPVDNRPSTDKLHPFVRKKNHVTCDM